MDRISGKSFHHGGQRIFKKIQNLGVLLIGLPVLGGIICLWGCENEPKPANPKEARYFSEIHQFRAAKDEHFKTAKNSPLFIGDMESFSGLKYFPVNPAMRFVLKLQKYEKPDTIDIMTTNGKDRPALRYGYFAFELEKEMHRLQVYKFLDNSSQYKPYLFVPFLDQTAGEETYGGGRYLDLEENETGIYEMDFNLAYNPSCAYGRKEYICPIPPSENTLSIAIRAGEKAWH